MIAKQFLAQQAIIGLTYKAEPLESLITLPPFTNITLKNGDLLDCDEFPYLLGASSNHK